MKRGKNIGTFCDQVCGRRCDSAGLQHTLLLVGASNSVKYKHHSHKLGVLNLVLSCQLPLLAF